MAPQEVRRIEGDRFAIDLDHRVRQVLLDLKEMAVAHLAVESPATTRIFPVTYQNSPEMELDFQKLTRAPLTDHHQACLDTFANTLFLDELSLDEILAWLGALNNIRFILGSALEIDQDREAPEKDDPNYEGFVVYDLLTYLQSAIIDELER